MQINDRPGIRNTFADRPDITEVHILADGTHYFTVAPNELTPDMVPITLQIGAADLEDEPAPAPDPTVKPAKA